MPEVVTQLLICLACVVACVAVSALVSRLARTGGERRAARRVASFAASGIEPQASPDSFELVRHGVRFAIELVTHTGLENAGTQRRAFTRRATRISRVEPVSTRSRLLARESFVVPATMATPEVRVPEAWGPTFRAYGDDAEALRAWLQANPPLAVGGFGALEHLLIFDGRASLMFEGEVAFGDDVTRLADLLECFARGGAGSTFAPAPPIRTEKDAGHGTAVGAALICSICSMIIVGSIGGKRTSIAFDDGARFAGQLAKLALSLAVPYVVIMSLHAISCLVANRRARRIDDAAPPRPQPPYR
jgi:hypothetical protein